MREDDRIENNHRIPLIAVALNEYEAVIRLLLNYIEVINQRDSYSSADIYVKAKDLDYSFKESSNRFKEERHLEFRNALLFFKSATYDRHVYIVKVMLDEETYRRKRKNISYIYR